jgi:hypothetical protein
VATLTVDSKGVIYDCNILSIHAIGVSVKEKSFTKLSLQSGLDHLEPDCRNSCPLGLKNLN